MEEKNKVPKNWEEFAKDYAATKKTASEAISDAWRISKAKDFAIGALVFGIVAVASVLSIVNYKNDCHWRDLFSSYDYVSQDGEGYNYYNSDIGGDVSNGTEDPEAEE